MILRSRKTKQAKTSNRCIYTFSYSMSARVLEIAVSHFIRYNFAVIRSVVQHIKMYKPNAESILVHKNPEIYKGTRLTYKKMKIGWQGETREIDLLRRFELSLWNIETVPNLRKE